MENQKYFFQPQYTEERTKLAEFIAQFQDASLKENPFHQKLKYMIQLVNYLFSKI